METHEKFKNKVVYIESEERLAEVKKLLLDNGEKEDDVFFCFNENNPKSNYLSFARNSWIISAKIIYDTEITFDQFVELLNQ